MNVSSRKVQDQLRADQRRQEIAREDVIKQVEKDRVLKAGLKSDVRVEEKRRLRNLQKEIMEMETIQNLEKKEIMKKMQMLEAEEEEKLASVLEQREKETLREEKFRQMIRENSVEIRELEAKLKAAYMNKERAAQIADAKTSREIEKNREIELIKAVNEEWEKSFAKTEDREELKWKANIEYKHALEQQLLEQEELKKEKFKEFLQEKMYIDSIVAKIMEEDQKEYEQRLAKQQETKSYIKEFIKQREYWRDVEKKRREEEDRKILEYARQKREREEKEMGKKREMADKAAGIYQKLAQEMEGREKKRLEMEEMLNDLYTEQQAERALKLEQDLLEKKARQREELLDAHNHQMRLKDEKEKMEKEQENAFREMMMQKFAEDDRLEQMNAQKRRMKQLEHKRAVEELLADRRSRWEAEQQRAIEERITEENMAALKEQIIEEERQRLLKEHSEKLIHFLPKGTLRDEKDLELFSEEFRKEFNSRTSAVLKQKFEDSIQ
eukprot:Nk52_evm33s1810 gene=Nk52_evmTU33s1810